MGAMKALRYGELDPGDDRRQALADEVGLHDPDDGGWTAEAFAEAAAELAADVEA
jgi:hypothetical protein